MSDGSLFQRILPPGIVADRMLYNLAAAGLSVLSALVCFGLLAVAAVASSYLVSRKLKAGIAGMSILLLFVLLAGALGVVVLVVLLATNLR